MAREPLAALVERSSVSGWGSPEDEPAQDRVPDVPVEDDQGLAPSQDTFFGKLYSLIETSFPGGEFSSSERAKGEMPTSSRSS